jgi:AcrR family transcriptional regulator
LQYRWYPDTVGIAMATRMSRAESKAATRTELLDAARRVFVERGYHGASLDLVAREAGYTKGAVYSAFGSKAHMFLAVYEREVDRRWTRIEQSFAAVGDFRGGTSHDWFERVKVERAWTLALLEFRLQAARDPELNALYAAGHSRVLERLAGVMRAGGVAEADARRLALDVVALSNGYALEHLALPGEATEERFAEAIGALTDRR